MEVNKTSWESANRYSWRSHVHLHCFTLGLFNIWFSYVFFFFFLTEEGIKTQSPQKVQGEPVQSTFRLKSRSRGNLFLLLFLCCSRFVTSLSCQNKSMHLDSDDPPGATSGDFMSEAARVSLGNTTRYLNEEPTLASNWDPSDRFVSEWNVF